MSNLFLMEIVKLILTIFLIAAINTLIIMVAVSVISRVRNKKENKEIESPQLSKLENPISEKPVSENQHKEIVKEDLTTLVKEIQEEPEIIKEEKKEVKPKFLKYTSKGYIAPEKDFVEKLKWR
jgi:Na+-translocating ferredoxin:NAD+ oxidoreductase RnfG subunit